MIFKIINILNIATNLLNFIYFLLQNKKYVKQKYVFCFHIPRAGETKNTA